MNQLLSDDEITLIVRECARGSAINRDSPTRIRKSLPRSMGDAAWETQSLLEYSEIVQERDVLLDALEACVRFDSGAIAEAQKLLKETK